MPDKELIELKFAELHNPLFLGGKNLQVKLDGHHHPGIEIHYDRAEKELLVRWNCETGIVPISNVACMIPGSAKKRDVPLSHPMTVNAGRTAQVSTPYGHVHAGPGAGKTGKDK